MDEINKKAYTLSEVVIVMLIIAVIVSIAIKASKTKLEKIVSYNYYVAYETVNQVTKSLYVDGDKEIEASLYDKIIAYTKYSINFLTTNLTPKALATSMGYEPCTMRKLQSCLNQGFGFDNATCKCTKPTGSIDCFIELSDIPCGYKVDKLTCKLIPEYFCADGTSWDPDKCQCVSSNDNNDNNDNDNDDKSNYLCKVGAQENCLESGGTFDPNTCKCTPNDEPSPNPIACNQNVIDTCAQRGGILDENCQCSVQACNDEKFWDPISQTCLSEPRTLPKKNFCELFDGKVNSNGETCKGSEISPETTDFTNEKPDITLRNGMRIYNLNQKYVRIKDLENSTLGKFFVDENGALIDIDQFGYIVYVDIDGAKGENALWYDVYPFYITLSGNVIPAYDKNTVGQSGGDSKFHLQTSVKDQYFTSDGKRLIQWHTKSTSFQQSACTMGLINESSEYCKGVTKTPDCESVTHDCQLKIIKPAKLLGII